MKKVMELFFCVLFLLPIGLGLYWIAAPHAGAFGWMPRHINPAFGDKVDLLYKIIFIVVAVMFFLTEGLLVWCMFKYRAKAGHKAQYIHGNKWAEITWTVIPGLMLLALGIGQAGTWAQVKSEFPDVDDPDTVVVQVFAQQFDWNFRYPGPDKQFGTEDDVVRRKDLVVPMGKKILLHMGSKDVIHSLFLPQVRVKQDVVPGMMTKTWFVADHIPVWNLKDQDLELLKQEDFDKKSVAAFPTHGNFKNPLIDKDGRPIDKNGRLIDKDGEVIDENSPKKSHHGRRKYFYEYDGEEDVPIWQDGSPRAGKAKDAEYAQHWLDLACAEL